MENRGRPLPAIGRLLPGVYYGWVVAVGSGFVAFVCVGIGFYSLSIFQDALVETHGWSRGAVSAASSLYFLVSGVGGTLVGRAIDRHGGLAWMGAGACLLALGLAGIGRAESPLALAGAYVVMATGFSMSSAVPTTALITRWFVRLRVRAMSVSQTGVSLGGALIVPYATWLLGARGLLAATDTLALVVVVVALPVILFVLRWDPADHGLKPDGSGGDHVINPLLSDEVQRRVWSGREALRTRAFLLVASAFSAILLCQTGTLIHEIVLLREHMTADAAALGITATAAGSIAGRLVVGAFADRVEKRRLCAVIFLVQACALLGLSIATDSFSLYAGAFAFGLTIGNVYMLQGLVIGELFGIPSYGRVYGMLQLITQIASALGPLVVGLLSQTSAGYPGTLRFQAVLVLAAAWIVSRVRPA